jgi:hypothetical protein
LLTSDAIDESIILTTVALKSIRAMLREVGELRQAPPVLRIEIDLLRITPDTIFQTANPTNPPCYVYSTRYDPVDGRQSIMRMRRRDRCG